MSTAARTLCNATFSVWSRTSARTSAMTPKVLRSPHECGWTAATASARGDRRHWRNVWLPRVGVDFEDETTCARLFHPRCHHRVDGGSYDPRKVSQARHVQISCARLRPVDSVNVLRSHGHVISAHTARTIAISVSR